MHKTHCTVEAAGTRFDVHLLPFREGPIRVPVAGGGVSFQRPVGGICDTLMVTRKVLPPGPLRIWVGDKAGTFHVVCPPHRDGLCGWIVWDAGPG